MFGHKEEVNTAGEQTDITIYDIIAISRVLKPLLRFYFNGVRRTDLELSVGQDIFDDIVCAC